jgi:bifunctional UDP-N-acetylglucosamine pyrophosphorylase / glucosamine-1-phosphate N-acetyltransferase
VPARQRVSWGAAVILAAVADAPLAVVLAAGRGTRMRSRLPKALHPLAGRPLLLHAVAAALAATGAEPLVIVSPEQPEVAAALDGVASTAEQVQARGTGDALRSVPPARRSAGPVLVLSGDTPLLRPDTLAALLARQRETGAACVLLGVVPADPRGFGRLVRDRNGAVARIVEERDLPPGEPVPAECNAGAYAFDGARLWPALERLGSDNAQGEVYLTDVVELLGGAEAVVAADPDEALGVNDRCQLAAAEAVLRRRTLDALMLAGVTVEDPATTYVDPEVRVGRDSVLLPMTVLRGATTLGEGCIVGPMAQLRDVRAGDRVRIGASSLEECELGDDVVIGQYDRLRPGTHLGAGVHVGTHAELKNSHVGAGSHISHFSCVLDSDVGRDVNVGAGTVTCNYDGEAKHRTVIGDGAFIGTDASLVAPVRVGAGAYVAAGSVITRDVPDGALAVERSRQTTIEGWAARRHRRREDAS